MKYIYISFLLLLGITMVVKPDLLWKIEHFWDVKNGELSEFIAIVVLNRLYINII